jgi:hypothetical protein
MSASGSGEQASAPPPGYLGETNIVKGLKIYQILIPNNKSILKKSIFSIPNTIGRSTKIVLNGLNVKLYANYGTALPENW